MRVKRVANTTERRESGLTALVIESSAKKVGDCGEMKG
jgi:hypothetical protein